MSNWDKMKESKRDSSNFIKLKDGEFIEGVFVGEPYCFYQNYTTKQESQEWFQGASFKFRINFIPIENGSMSKTARIFQQGAMARDALLGVREEYSLNCVYKIKRTGSSKDDTVYSILFKSNLTEEQLAKIKTVPLNALDFNAGSKINDEAPPIGDNDLPSFEEEPF